MKVEDDSGLILFEVLVALVIFSILTASALNLLDRVANLANDPVRTDFSSIVSRLQSEPSKHELNSELFLVKERIDEDGSVWRVYRYTPTGGDSVKIPVFYPEGIKP